MHASRVFKRFPHNAPENRSTCGDTLRRGHKIYLRLRRKTAISALLRAKKEPPVGGSFLKRDYFLMLLNQLFTRSGLRIRKKPQAQRTTAIYQQAAGWKPSSMMEPMRVNSIETAYTQ